MFFRRTLWICQAVLLEGSPTIRWTTLRALGLQLPETGAVWSKLAAVPASSSRRSSNSGLRSTRTPHIVRSLPSMPTSFTVGPLMLVKSSTRDAVASSFAWNWSNTPVSEVPHDVRGATALDDQTPSARFLDETPEIIHAHSGPWLNKNVYPLLAVIATCSPTGAGAASTGTCAAPTIGARAIYSTNGVSTACNAGASAMYSSTGAGAT